MKKTWGFPLVLLAIAVVLWTYLGTRDRVGQGVAKVPHAASSGLDQDFNADLAPQTKGDPSRRELTTEAHEDGAPAPEKNKDVWLLRGILHGIELYPQRPHVVISSVTTGIRPPGDTIRVVPTTDGTFQADITEIAENPYLRSSEVRILLEHNGQLLYEERALLQNARRETGNDGGYSYVLEVSLNPPTEGVIVGTLADSLGNSVSGGEIFLCLPQEAGPPRAVLATKTNDEGQFTLTPVKPGEYILAGVEQNHRPHTQLLVVGAIRTDIGRIQLEAGEYIRGVVASRPASSIEAREGFMLSALPGFPGERADFVQRLLYWTNDRFEHGVRRANTGQDGEFAFLGLAPGKYLILSSGAPASCALAGVPGRRVRAEAPTTDLVVAFSDPRIRFQVSGPEGPVGNVAIEVSAGESVTTCITARNGETVVSTPPLAELSVTLSKLGWVPVSYGMVSPATGATDEQIIFMSPEELSGSLLVDVRGPDREVISQAGFGFFTPMIDTEEWSLWFVKDSYSDSGVHRLTGIPDGRYRILVHPEGSWNDYLTYYLDGIATDVRVRSATEERLVISLELGGRLQLRVRGEDERVVPAQVLLRDDQGNALTVQFHYLNQSTGTVYRHPLVPHQFLLDSQTYVDVRPSLPEGEYEAEIALDGYETTFTTFTIEKEKIFRLPVVLRTSR